ncbi:Membrane protein involved in the export of O-antigen and teichoic acid [Catalinimonas alkaloidigena]|uniref:Membrane protein involved in the export of O-antigen and teichoic acid n=1 Tax=Catalinimonas alkaloidigena TaxID=1075417 RepID=A0A1G9DWC3_9BACT|nr:oligosaccharide flippase family protein [Catalinimonas alkaloidigena]SDK68154.1 Membrane protein involved in the export of O-antigen and teichoic acid [Catalinimonas alkaloidigena]
MSVLKKLAGETVLYGLSSIVGRAINFLLVPLYTKLFAAGEYGVVGELYAYVGALNVIFTYGMETSYFRFATREGIDRREAYSNAMSAVLTTTLVLTGVLVASAGSIADLLEYPGKSMYIVWLALTVGIDAVVAIPFARLRLEGKALKFALARLINIGANIGLNLFFLFFCRWVYEGTFLPSLKPLIGWFYNPELGVGYVFLSNLLANALFLILLRKELFDFRWQLRWPQLRPMLLYAYPLLFMGLAGVINETLDRPMLKYWLPEGFYPNRSNQQIMGIYSACYKLAVIINLGIQAFRYASEPFFFSRASDKQSPVLFARVMHWFIIACVFLFVGISLNLEWIGRLVLGRPEYYEGLGVVPILLMAYVWVGIYFNLSVWYKLTDRTVWGMVFSLGGALVTIVLNIVLIPVLGYYGSAWATLICYVSMGVGSYLIGQRYFPVPYRTWTDLGYLLLGIGVVLIAQWVEPTNLWMKYSFRLGLLLAFAAVVFIFERHHLRALRAPVQKS